MDRRALHRTGVLLSLLALFASGCESHSPFKFSKDDDLGHYVDVATKIDTPNIANCPTDASITCPSPLLITPDSNPEYWNIKLEEAMQMALTRSKVLHDLGGTVLRSPANARTIMGPAITDTDPRYGVEAALSEFDAIFSQKFDYQRNNRLVNNDLIGDNTNHLLEDADTFQTQISKKSATGAEFDFRHNTYYDHSNTSVDKFRSSWDTNFEFEARQPLLQGAGVEFNRIAGPSGTPGNLNGVLLARVNTDISLAEFEIGVRDLVSNVENSYWDLYFAYRDLDSKIQARNTALESWQRTHALAEKGRQGGEAEREAEAREQYFLFQQEVENAWSGRLVGGTQTNNGSNGGTLRGVGGVRVAERRLRLLLGLPINDCKLLRPADEPSMAKVVFCWEDVLPEAISRRPELRRQRWVIKREELALIASKNFLLPRLDAYSLYRLRGFGHDLKDGDDGIADNSAFQDLDSFKHQEWEMGMELNVPLGFRRGHAAVQNAQLILARERALLDDQEREVVHDLSNAVGDIQRSYEVAQTAYNRRMAARAQVAATRAALESERKVPLDLYLEAQRRLADADSQFFAALADYALSIKNLHYEKGSLLEYNDVYLAEGPWPEKAYHDAANLVPAHHQPRPMSYIMTQTPPPIGQDANAAPVPPPNEMHPYPHGVELNRPLVGPTGPVIDGGMSPQLGAPQSVAPQSGAPQLGPPQLGPPRQPPATPPQGDELRLPPQPGQGAMHAPTMAPSVVAMRQTPAPSAMSAPAPIAIPSAAPSATPTPAPLRVAANSTPIVTPAPQPKLAPDNRFENHPDSRFGPANTTLTVAPQTRSIAEPTTPRFKLDGPGTAPTSAAPPAAVNNPAPAPAPATDRWRPTPNVGTPTPAPESNSASAASSLRLAPSFGPSFSAASPTVQSVAQRPQPQPAPVALSPLPPVDSHVAQAPQTMSMSRLPAPTAAMTSAAPVSVPAAMNYPTTLPPRATNSSVERWQVPAQSTSAPASAMDDGDRSIFSRPPQGSFSRDSAIAPTTLTVRPTGASRMPWPDASGNGAPAADQSASGGGIGGRAPSGTQNSAWIAPTGVGNTVRPASYPALDSAPQRIAPPADSFGSAPSNSFGSAPQPTPTVHVAPRFERLPATTLDPLPPTTNMQPLPSTNMQPLPPVR